MGNSAGEAQRDTGGAGACGKHFPKHTEKSQLNQWKKKRKGDKGK